MIQDAIFARLSNVSALTALVPVARIKFRLLDQDTAYPAIRYFKVSEQRDAAMGSDSGVVRARFQFDVLDTDIDSIRDVQEQLRQALERYRGTFTVGVTKQWFDTFIDNQLEPEPELVDAVAVFKGVTDVLIDYQD